MVWHVQVKCRGGGTARHRSGQRKAVGGDADRAGEGGLILGGVGGAGVEEAAVGPTRERVAVAACWGVDAVLPAIGIDEAIAKESGSLFLPLLLLASVIKCIAVVTAAPPWAAGPKVPSAAVRSVVVGGIVGAYGGVVRGDAETQPNGDAPPAPGDLWGRCVEGKWRF